VPRSHYRYSMNHLSVDDLERYYLGMVKDQGELASLEEHLLWCHYCVGRAEAVEDFVDAIRVALLRVNN
jgi:hypothetical protein